MKRPTRKPRYKSTFHRDGTVSYWNVFRQSWERRATCNISDRVQSSMNSKDRKRIAKTCDI